MGAAGNAKNIKNPEALITCRNLALGYDGKEILRDLSFTVHSGDYLCVVGENGSGKTTLMKTILGLRAPLAGQIRTGGGLSVNEIGYLPQRTEIQRDFPATVREIVLSGCLSGRGFRPFYSEADKITAENQMEKMGVSNLRRRCYRELSGGQRQRVLLARALCAARKVLLLDEPVSGLDPDTTKELYDLIRKLNHDDNMAVIMISHDIAAAIRDASHILHIGGSRFFFGAKEKYLQSGLCPSPYGI